MPDYAALSIIDLTRQGELSNINALAMTRSLMRDTLAI